MNNPYQDLDKYGLLHLPSHLIDSESWDDLANIICDLKFITAKCSAGMTYELIDDYNSAINALPDRTGEKQNRIKNKKDLSHYIATLIKYARGGIETLENIPSIAPLKNEIIQKTTEKIYNTPSIFDRIAAFYNFVSVDSISFDQYSTWPGFIIQQAYNWSKNDPVGIAAEKLLSSYDDISLIIRSPSDRPILNPNSALLRILDDCHSTIFALDMTPDGRTAVSGGHDRLLKVWDIETGRCLHRLEGHDGLINRASLSPDGQLAASTSGDNTIKIWDIGKGICLHTTDIFNDSFFAPSFSADGQRLTALNRDNRIRIWDVKTGNCLKTLGKEDFMANDMAVTADAGFAVFACMDNTVQIWDLEKQDCLRSISAHTKMVRCVSVTPDGRFFLSGSEDNTAKLWDTGTGCCLCEFIGHNQAITSVDLSADGKIGITAGWDKTIRVWDTANGKCLRVFKGHSDSILKVKISADARIAISTGYDGTIRVWNIYSGLSETDLTYLYGSLRTARSENGRIAISGKGEKILQVWDLAENKCLRKIGPFPKHIVNLTLSGDGQIAMVSFNDENIYIWNIKKGVCLQTIQGNRTGAWDIDLSFNGSTAIVADKDNTLRIWGTNHGQRLCSIDYHAFSVSLAKDGRYAITGSDDNTVRIWSTNIGDYLKTMEGHTDFIRTVALSPKGHFAVSGSKDNTIRVWELATCKCVGLIDHRCEPVEISIFDKYLKIRDWNRDDTLYEITNIDTIKPFDINLFEDIYKKQKKKIKKVKYTNVFMKYRIQCYEEIDAIKYHGQSETLDDYTFRNSGPFATVEELLNDLDKGMQEAANAHKKIYTVRVFEIFPEGFIQEPQARRFIPNK